MRKGEIVTDIPSRKYGKINYMLTKGMKVSIKRAKSIEIDKLVKDRIKVLRVANLLDDDNNFIIYLAYYGNEIIVSWGVGFYRVMPIKNNKTCECIYIMNMYTDLSFRKKGIGTKILDLLINDIKIYVYNIMKLDFNNRRYYDTCIK